MSESEWTVGVVAETVQGEVVLRMTEEQAASLRDTLTWLCEEDDPS
jgi:hypothetical protein